jgi:hypothetical protein
LKDAFGSKKSEKAPGQNIFMFKPQYFILMQNLPISLPFSTLWDEFWLVDWLVGPGVSPDRDDWVSSCWLNNGGGGLCKIQNKNLVKIENIGISYKVDWNEKQNSLSNNTGKSLEIYWKPSLRISQNSGITFLKGTRIVNFQSSVQ